MTVKAKADSAVSKWGVVESGLGRGARPYPEAKFGTFLMKFGKLNVYICPLKCIFGRLKPILTVPVVLKYDNMIIFFI